MSLNEDEFKNLINTSQITKIEHHIDNGDVDLEVKWSFCRTPLLHAVLKDKYEVVCLLLRKGSNVHATDMHGMTALHIAYNHCVSKEIVAVLLKYGVDPKQKNTYGVLPHEYGKGARRNSRLCSIS